jgi:hypothetical protein
MTETTSKNKSDDRLVTTQYEFLRSVVHSADRSLRKPDDSHS